MRIFTENAFNVMAWFLHYAIHLVGFLLLMVVLGLLTGFDITHSNVYYFLGGFVVLEVLWYLYERHQHAKVAELHRLWDDLNNEENKSG